MVANDGIIADLEEYKKNSAFFEEFNAMPGGGDAIGDHYTKYADKYEYLVKTIGYIEPQTIRDLLMPFKYDKETTKIVDFGCGSGWVARHVSELGYKNFTGVDASAGLLEQAKETATEPRSEEVGSLDD